MADIKKIAGSDGEREGEGEGGERGHRGHRGHRGPTGPTGPSGFTGFTGATGPSNARDLAYGFAVNDEEQTIAANSDVLFNLGGTPFPNVGITVPAPGGSAFVVLSDGDYEYNFYVAAHNLDTPGTRAPEFAIFLDGVSQGPAHEFQSNHQGLTTDAAALMICRGQGIISIGLGTTVTLRNRTGAGTEKLVAVANAPGGEQCANATLSLKKLSS